MQNQHLTYISNLNQRHKKFLEFSLDFIFYHYQKMFKEISKLQEIIFLYFLNLPLDCCKHIHIFSPFWDFLHQNY